MPDTLRQDSQSGAPAGKESLWVKGARYDLRSGTTGARRRTASGGLVVDAHVTRTGVLTYRQPDGSVRREYRPPEEVFHPDSLATLAHATLTDDHPGKVDPGNWRRNAIGHVAGDPPPRRDGDKVATELHLQHDDAIEKAEDGDLQEASCGYDCHYDPTPGRSPEGEKYDGVQRRIRYNHVALGPPGWGRAGPDVRLRLDSNTAISGFEERADFDDDQPRDETGKWSSGGGGGGAGAAAKPKGRVLSAVHGVLGHAAKAIRSAPGKFVEGVKKQIHEAKTAFEGVHHALTGKEVTPEHKAAIKKVALKLAVAAASHGLSAALPLAGVLHAEVARKVAEKVAHHVAQHALKHVVHKGLGIHLDAATASAIDPEEWLEAQVREAVAAELEKLTEEELGEVAGEHLSEPPAEPRTQPDPGIGNRGDSSPYVRGMTEEEKRALEAAQREAREAKEALEKQRTDAAAMTTRLDALEKTNATLKAENDLLKSHEAKFTADAKRAAEEEATKRSDANFEKRVEEIVGLRADAKEFLHTEEHPFDPIGKKADEIRRAVLLKIEPFYAEDSKRLDAVTAEALPSVYAISVARARKDAHDDAWDNVRDIVNGARSDRAGPKPMPGSDDENCDSMTEAQKSFQRKKDAAKNRRDREQKARDARGGR